MSAEEKAKVLELQQKVAELNREADAANPEGHYSTAERGGSEAIRKHRAFEAEREAKKAKAQQAEAEYQNLIASNPALASYAENHPATQYEVKRLAYTQTGYDPATQPDRSRNKGDLDVRRTEMIEGIARANPSFSITQVSQEYKSRSGNLNPPNAAVEYEATLRAREQGFNVGSGLVSNLAPTFQKEEDRRFGERNKFVGLTETITTEKSTVKPGTKTAYTVGLSETLGGERTSQPKAYGISLTEGAPREPRKLSQDQVNKLSQSEYAIYKSEYDQYNAFVNAQNEKIKAQNETIRKTNLSGWKETKQNLKGFISEAKASGAKLISINTDAGVKTVPIEDAFYEIVKSRNKGVKGIEVIPEIPKGFTVAGSPGVNMVFVPEGDQFVGPRKPKQKDYIGNLRGELGLDTPVIAAMDQKKLTVESAGKAFVDPARNLGTILSAFPTGVYKEATEGFGAGQKYYENEIEPKLKPTLFGSALSGEPSGRSSAEQKITILGDVALAALPGMAGKLFERIKGTSKTRVTPQTNAPPVETIQPRTNTLNNLYREPLKLETPEQGLLRQSKRERIVQARVKEVTALGVDKAVIRFNPKTEKIDAEILNMQLGKGSGFTVKGKTNPQFTRSGEAPKSTQFKELKKQNILDNQKRAELSDVLSSDTMNKMTPKKPDSGIVTERELNELKELKKKNILDNQKKQELGGTLSADTMNRLSPKKPELNAITEREVNELKELKKQRPNPKLSETNVNLGKGSPDILRLSGDKITKIPKGEEKTFIEKVINLRRHKELEEREPLKFYVKKELGYPDTEPIDMTGRIDIGFETASLGRGAGFITKGKTNPPFTRSGEAPKSTQFKELKKQNILDNQKRAELSDTLSDDAMNKMVRKKPDSGIVTEREVKELKELRKQNIAEKEKPKLLLKADQPEKSPIVKVDLRDQIMDDLFVKAGFKKTTMSLGQTDKVMLISTGGAAVVPVPLFVTAENDEPDMGLLTNQTQTNQTETVPPIIIEDEITQTSPSQELQSVSQSRPKVIGAITGATSLEGLVGSARQRETQRQRVSVMPHIPSTRPTRLTQPLTFRQPQRKRTPLFIFGNPFPNSSIPTLDTPLRIPEIPRIDIPPRQRPRTRPPRPPAFPFKVKERKTKKERAEEKEKADFLGNTQVSSLLSFRTTKTDITYGRAKIVGLVSRDVTKSGRGRFSNERSGTILKKDKGSIRKVSKKKWAL